MSPLCFYIALVIVGRHTAVALIGAQVAEAPPTLMAAVRGGSTVDSLVGVQVAQLLEASTTLRTSVGTLSRVNTLVSL